MNNGYYNQLPIQGTSPNQADKYTYNTYNTYTNSNYIRPEYADNIFQQNIGKRVRIFFSYPDSLEWRDKVAEGIIRASGKDYIVITDDRGYDVLFWLIYINYAEFEQSINI